jgi:hypothetical protein
LATFLERNEMQKEIQVTRMKPWIAKTLIGILLVLAVVIAILSWSTNNVLFVVGLSLVFFADCLVLNRFGEIKIFIPEEEDND